jgi:hypothetical protein
MTPRPELLNNYEMRDKNTIIFQYYGNEINSSRPQGTVTLYQFIRSTRNPKPETLDLFRRIAEATIAGDMELKARLKEKLYSFTPCVVVSEFRRKNCIKAFTGILVLDFDKIDFAEEFRDYLFDIYDCIIAAWVSPSKRGTKALVNIPVVENLDEFKSYYFGIAAEMDQYKGFDSSGQNAVLPLFQSFDPELRVRDDPAYWTQKGIMRGAKPSTPAPVTNYTRDAERVGKMIRTGINKIVDNGHPQLRSICLSVGGYVANNYIDYSEAIQLIDYLIEQNGYLSKGVPGYKKTALWALNQGTHNPLTLKKN